MSIDSVLAGEINKIPNEGIRLKKFRKPILTLFTGDDMTEQTVKEKFAECLDKYCRDGIVSLEGGILTRIITASSDESIENKVEEEEPNDNESDNVSAAKIAIEEEINKIPPEGIRLKKFRKAVMDQFPEMPVQDLKDEFAVHLDSFCAENIVSLDGGILTRLVDEVNVSKLKKRKAGDNNWKDQKVKYAKVDEDVAKKELWKYGEQMWAEGTLDGNYVSENPDGITRIFCGNLKRDITEDQLHNAINGITHIKWMTDKVTREFYGSTFLEMKDPRAAAAAVMLDKTKLLGRPLKIYYCPPRPGDIWPPKEQGSAPNNPAPRSTREIQSKPPGCRKLFCGNLSYNIDDDTICHFFKDCGVLTGLRWLTRKETGEFRGCAFVEFGSTGEADLAILKNGEELLGRPIRLDWDK